jgi:hypothetical protein
MYGVVTTFGPLDKAFVVISLSNAHCHCCSYPFFVLLSTRSTPFTMLARCPYKRSLCIHACTKKKPVVCQLQEKTRSCLIIMKIKPLPTSLSELPVFSYSRVTKDASVSSTCQQKTTYKAISLIKGKEEYTRHISQNMIDLAKWEGAKKPSSFPSGLNFPEDILKAVLYSRKKRRTAKKAPKKKTCKASSAPADGVVVAPKPPQPIAKDYEICASCESVAKIAAQLCTCSSPPWSKVATDAWREKHVELRYISPAVGLGTYARMRLRAASVLGEYVGEIVHGRGELLDTLYLLTVPDDTGRESVFIDALRVGGWTRFINHSCRANTFFESRRVGEEVRVVVMTERGVKKGEEVTVNYGEQYWEAMNLKGVWCVCGEEGCRFGEPKRLARRREGR